jgi:hypothetical protein
MRHLKSIPAVLFALAAVQAAPLGAAPTTDAPASGPVSLLVAPHAGAEAVDVSGRAPAGTDLTITLVSTIDVDLPDVVLNRKTLVTGPDGTFAAVMSIAPGYTRGSIITVFATSSDGGPAVTARYVVNAPNRGVPIPLDDIPRNVR